MLDLPMPVSRPARVASIRRPAWLLARKSSTEAPARVHRGRPMPNRPGQMPWRNRMWAMRHAFEDAIVPASRIAWKRAL